MNTQIINIKKLRYIQSIVYLNQNKKRYVEFSY
jgi:hypothetical protein